MITSEVQTTVRNAGWILVQRLLHVGSGLVFALLVPRLMGPDVYGRYSLLSSLAVWFALFSSLNLKDVIGRHVPEFVLQRDSDSLQKLWSDLFTVRLASAVLTATVFLGITVVWLRDLDERLLATVAAMILVRAIADLVFAAFLGFNQAARWQLGETVRQWLSVGLVIAGFALGELQGAVFGLWLTELVVLALGLYWIRPYLSWPALHLDVRRSLPHIRFGLILFASGLFHTALAPSAEALLRTITRDYAAVGYFGLAWRVLITLSLAITQVGSAFLPLLAQLHAQGNTEAVGIWLERLLRYTVIGGTLASMGVLFLAEDMVPWVLGAEFGPAADSLVWLVLTLIPIALATVARLVTLVYLQPQLALGVAAIHLASFWLLAIPLTVWLAEVGSSISMFVAWALYAALFTWRARNVLRYSLRGSLLVIGLAVLFLPLLFLRSSWQINAGLLLLSLAGYLGILLWVRVVTVEEAAQLWRAITQRSRAQGLEAQGG